MKTQWLCGLAGLLLMGCQSGLVAPASEQKALQQCSAEWDRLFNARDAARLAQLYAADAVSMPPGAATLQGREALRKEFESFFAANTARHETTVDQLLIEGDLSIESARYRLISKRSGDNSETIETGRHLECRRRISGQWQIVLEIWNVDTPPAK
jgi:uncharacterized protein (TIGR02246 family)